MFPVADYAALGCEVADPGSWPDAPADAVVLGIKELPEQPRALRHTHVYFAHAFKGQVGAGELLDRFAEGGGELLDVEYLTVDGRRVVAFGYWAGYVGAGLGVRSRPGRPRRAGGPGNARRLRRGPGRSRRRRRCAPSSSGRTAGAAGARWRPSRWPAPR